MSPLLALSSVRVGLYIGASGGVSYLLSPAPATLTLAIIGGLVFMLGVVGPRLPFARQLPYALVLLAVGAVTLGLGGLPVLIAGLDWTRESVLAPVMRLVGAFLGGLLTAVTLYSMMNTREA